MPAQVLGRQRIVDAVGGQHEDVVRRQVFGQVVHLEVQIHAEGIGEHRLLAVVAGKLLEFAVPEPVHTAVADVEGRARCGPWRSPRSSYTPSRPWWQSQRLSALRTRAADALTVHVSGVARYSSMNSVTVVWLALAACSPLETPSAITATAPLIRSGGARGERILVDGARPGERGTAVADAEFGAAHRQRRAQATSINSTVPSSRTSAMCPRGLFHEEQGEEADHRRDADDREEDIKADHREDRQVAHPRRCCHRPPVMPAI